MVNGALGRVHYFVETEEMCRSKKNKQKKNTGKLWLRPRGDPLKEPRRTDLDPIAVKPPLYLARGAPRLWSEIAKSKLCIPLSYP